MPLRLEIKVRSRRTVGDGVRRRAANSHSPPDPTVFFFPRRTPHASYAASPLCRLSLRVQRKLSSRSDRVKSVDIHPTEPWVLSAMYNGHVFLWNYNTQSLVKSFEVSDQPVRAAKFVPRKQWIIAGADDMQMRVYNYNTIEKVKTFEAHSDYIRCICIHPSQPLMLTSSDDMTIRLWDWDKGWANTQTYEGHSHYVMMVAFNPKDANTFASASLDRSIKVTARRAPLCARTAHSARPPPRSSCAPLSLRACADFWRASREPLAGVGAQHRPAALYARGPRQGRQLHRLLHRRRPAVPRLGRGRQHGQGVGLPDEAVRADDGGARAQCRDRLLPPRVADHHVGLGGRFV